MKNILFLYFFTLLSLLCFGQSYTFPISNNNYNVIELKDDQNKINGYFLVNTNKGFHFDILDKNLTKISSGSSSELVPYNFLNLFRSVKLINDKLSVSKIYYNPNTYSFPFEATYIFDVKTGAFEKMFYQKEQELVLSETEQSFHQIMKGQNGKNLSEVTPIAYNNKTFFVVESYVLPKVYLFSSKIRESKIEILDGKGSPIWEIFKNYRDSLEQSFYNLISIKNGKVFILESNFESKRKFLGSVLKIYNLDDGKLISSINVNTESSQFLDISRVEEFEGGFTLIGLYKSPSKTYNDLIESKYAGFYRWKLKEDGTTISRNLYGWLRLTAKLDFFIGRKDEVSNYLNPLISFDTKNGFSFILKNERDDLYSSQTKNYFLLNFDSKNEFTSFKKYNKDEISFVDFNYDQTKKQLNILEFEHLKKNSGNLKIANSDTNFISKSFQLTEDNVTPNSITDDHKVLMISKEKDNLILNLVTINL